MNTLIEQYVIYGVAVDVYDVPNKPYVEVHFSTPETFIKKFFAGGDIATKIERYASSIVRNASLNKAIKKVKGA